MRSMYPFLCFIAAMAVTTGCTQNATEPNTSSAAPPPAKGGAQARLDQAAAPITVQKEEPRSAKPGDSVTVSLKFSKGQMYKYSLTNDIQILVGEGDQAMRQDTFLNATQTALVESSQGGLSTVSVTTEAVKSAFKSDDPDLANAESYLKQTADAIEGSILAGDFDSRGQGSNLRLIGDGVGLNPMGPQAGGQDVMVGLMGVLLPPPNSKVGDTWTATYDFDQSAKDMFANQAAKTKNSKVMITYRLLDFDKSKSLVKIGVTVRGKPVIEVAGSDKPVAVEIFVEANGEARLNYSDGWLDELRLQTTVVTKGFINSRQVVQTVTKRL